MLKFVQYIFLYFEHTEIIAKRTNNVQNVWIDLQTNGIIGIKTYFRVHKVLFGKRFGRIAYYKYNQSAPFRLFYI